jgi:hypothetical protein
MSIGEHIPDAVVQHGHMDIYVGSPAESWIGDGEGVVYKLSYAPGGGSKHYYVGSVIAEPNANYTPRIANENRPASVSASLYMKY